MDSQSAGTTLSALLRQFQATEEQRVKNERELRDRVTRFLVDEAGYPLDAIAHEPHLGSSLRPDIVLLDRQSGRYLAVLELKLMKEAQAQQQAWQLKQQVAALGQLVGSRTIPFFLVVPSSVSDFAILEPVDGGAWRAVDRTDFPFYEAARSLAKTKAVVEVTQAARTESRVLSRTVFLLCALAGEILLLSALGWWAPTWQALTLAAALAFFALMTHTRRMKLLGLEYELLDEKLDRHTAAGSKPGA